ncbi:hypothetical protein BDV38DRAFT_244743 [Aspergillus pseudotamarii]|uniref:Secreted protein n=1 Tax=Aspergillus pseudotamarii TaxID=132259 RepID=A0A5N6SUX5_ASPPS|nr:uncharacterized protein BDV38DRAFT_244743 [Aspergillus pseudotamarii]KAE8138486.1 hypothetical protein BDV38DRAFT_244743 [Aspergillus pseudotamarii]
MTAFVQTTAVFAVLSCHILLLDPFNHHTKKCIPNTCPVFLKSSGIRLRGNIVSLSRCTSDLTALPPGMIRPSIPSAGFSGYAADVKPAVPHLSHSPGKQTPKRFHKQNL